MPPKLDEASFESLMLLYQQGDEEAFKALYREYGPRVYGYLRNRVADGNRVDELFQLVFLKLHQSRAQYDSKLPLSPWLFTICRTVLIDALRGGQVFASTGTTTLETVIATMGDTPAFYKETEDAAEKLKIQQLPEEKRKVLELRYFENLSFETIAKRLKITEPTARQRVSRAVRSLKQLVQGKGSGR